MLTIIEPRPPGKSPGERLKAALGSGDSFFVRTRRGQEKLNLLFSATKSIQVSSAGEHSRVNIQLGPKNAKRGSGLLKLRLGVNICGEESLDTFFVTSVAAGVNWRGSELVELAQVLGRWLGVRRLMLTDAAIVGCPSAELYDLSLFVLAKYGVTWYMRMGFKPCVHPSVRCHARQLERKHLRVLERAVKSVRGLTTADVVGDARAIVGAIKSTPTETALSSIKFDEFTLWQRSKIVREDAALYSSEKLRILVGVHSHLKKVAESVPESSEAFMDWFVKLQKTDCGAFHDIYEALFDNEVYYWRSRRCMYHIEVNGERRVFRLAAGMQLISAVLDPIQSGELWFEKTISA